jgi:hypothetical protein
MVPYPVAGVKIACADLGAGSLHHVYLHPLLVELALERVFKLKLEGQKPCLKQGVSK